MAKNRPPTFEERVAALKAANAPKGEPLSTQEAERQLLIRRTAAKRRAASKSRVTKQDRATQQSARGILSDLQAEQQFLDAGLPGEALPGPGQNTVDVVGLVKTDGSDIPGPFVTTNSEGNKVRHYTKAVKNPHTGGIQIQPFPNPETGKGLSTTFGDAKTSNIPGVTYDPRWETPYPPEWKGQDVMKAQIGDQASELTGKHALWLSGDKSVRADNSTRIEDFIDPINSDTYDDAVARRKNVDYVSRTGTIDAQVNPGAPFGPKTRGVRSQSQLFTVLEPSVDNGPSSFLDDIFDRMDASGKGFRPTIRDMQSDGSVGKVHAGKTAKYDKVLALEFDDNVNNRNMGYSPNPRLKVSAKDKIVQPPERVSLVDMKKVDTALEKAKSRDLRGKIKLRSGAKRNYPTPGYVANIELKGNSDAITDISGKGHVPQILDDIPYREGYTPKASKGGSVTPVSTPDTVTGVKAPKPGKISIDGSKPTAARYRAKDKGMARRPTPAVVNDVPTAKVEPVAPTPPQAVRPVAQPIAPTRPTAPVAPVARPTSTAQPPVRRGQNAALQRPKGPPKGERGFIATPGRVRAKNVVKPRVGGAGGKLLKGGLVADIAIDGSLSYLTGETDNIGEAAYKGATSLIPDSGGTAKTMLIDDKVYTHDESTNMVYDHTGKVQGLAYKDGKPVAVPYGSLEGRTSMVDDVVDPLKQIGTAIRDTAVRRVSSFLNR